MISETITYKDFNGIERKEVLYFNLTAEEIVAMQMHSAKGIQVEMQEAIDSGDTGQVYDFIKGLVNKSYGVKSADGRRHDKNAQLLEEFQAMAFYSDFMLGMVMNNGSKGVEFINRVMPKEALEKAMAQIQGQQQPVANAQMPEGQQYGLSAREQFAQTQQAPARDSFGQAPTVIPQADDAQFLAFQEFQRQQAAAQAAIQESQPQPEPFRVRAEDPDAAGSNGL